MLTLYISVIVYQTTSYEAESCPGPNNITLELGSSQIIASPMYGVANYPNDIECTWLITVPEGMVSIKYAVLFGTSNSLNMLSDTKID